MASPVTQSPAMIDAPKLNFHWRPLESTEADGVTTWRYQTLPVMETIKPLLVAPPGWMVKQYPVRTQLASGKWIWRASIAQMPGWKPKPTIEEVEAAKKERTTE
jgi:hypothetical protein